MEEGGGGSDSRQPQSSFFKKGGGVFFLRAGNAPERASTPAVQPGWGANGIGALDPAADRPTGRLEKRKSKIICIGQKM